VLRDEVGHLSGARSAGNADHRSFTARPTAKMLRRVTIRDERNQGELVLLSDLPADDVPAHVIGLIYRQRWQVELFFKWLKCWAGFDHLLSHDPRGITLQFYVAVIASLLTHLATGRRVSKYNLLYLGWVAQGLMSWQDMEAGLAVIEREKELQRARLKRKRDAAAAAAAAKTSR
jgi:DDE family transposase